MHHIGKILKMNHKCVQGEVISSQKMHSFQFHAKVPSTLITLSSNAESLVHSTTHVLLGAAVSSSLVLTAIVILEMILFNFLRLLE